MLSSPHPPVLLAALGPDARRLSPEALAYVSGEGADRAGVVRVSGVFDQAGTRRALLMRLARPFLGPGLLITRRETNVPFDVVNTHSTDPSGRPLLSAVRTLKFRAGAQSFCDTMQLGPTPGTVRNRLGKQGRLELLLECVTTASGGFRLRSRTTRVQVGGRSRYARWGFSLPRRWGVMVEVDHGYDSDRGLHTISAICRLPLLGTLLEYSGSFAHGSAS